MRTGQTFDQEKVSFNLAKLKKGGEMFEVVIDPDLAIDYVEGEDVDVKEVLKAEKVFSDAKKGLLASEEHTQSLFNTTDALEIAKVLLKEGEVQLTAEHRDRIREDKRRRMMERIRVNAVDPKTGLPHPAKRIELAFEEAKIKVEETLSVDKQIKEIVKKLQVVLPIRFEQAIMRIHLKAEDAQKAYGDVKKFGTMLQEEWLNDGSWMCRVEIPAGLQNEFTDMLNEKTQGNAEIEKVKRNEK